MPNFCQLCKFSNCNNFLWVGQKLISLMLTKNFRTEKRLTYNIPRFQVLRAIHDWHHLLVLLPLAYILCLPLSLPWTSIIKHEQISLPRKFKYFKSCFYTAKSLWAGMGILGWFLVGGKYIDTYYWFLHTTEPQEK